MSSASTLTSKGQVTIPSHIRKRLGLKAGDRVAFVEHDGRIVLQPVQNDIRAIFGLLKASKSVSLEDMEQAIRERAAQRLK